MKDKSAEIMLDSSPSPDVIQQYSISELLTAVCTVAVFKTNIKHNLHCSNPQTLLFFSYAQLKEKTNIDIGINSITEQHKKNDILIILITHTL